MNIINSMPSCFYHPIQVVFFDDNVAFLSAMELEFSSQFNLLTFTNFEDTIKVIENQCKDLREIFFRLNYNTTNDFSTDNVAESYDIINHIYDKTRFKHVPILVIDYDMPGMNGLEFCQKIKEKKIFKIMLTAEADKDTAIEAFNNRLIDKFILKTSNNLHQEILVAINEFTKRYFIDLSSNLLSWYGNTIKELFENTLYQELFSSLLLETQAVEYYLVDNSGSFLFLDKNANPTWLIMKSNNALKDQLDLLEGYELSEPILKSIIKKEKILFLLSENEYKRPLSEWMNYLFDSKSLDANHYYSIVQEPLTDSINWKTIVSYAESQL